jgi:WhiB family redox-sensing transcriptional regulator
VTGPGAGRDGGWSTWLVEPAALPAWLALRAALEVVTRRPPCQERPDVWFASAQSRQLGEALTGCASCSLLHLCASYALTAGEPAGVWGGTTEAQRRAARRTA